MDRKLTIFYTSDIHGYFSPVDYAGNRPAATGLANCAANFLDDGNTLILDGGDTLQGSPFTYWLYSRTAEKSLVPARLMNLAGYHFVTLGNHDFNYGVEELQRYLNALDAKCLCANVEGLDKVEKTAVVTLANGLRVGITGVTSQFAPHWEKPENIEGLRFTDAFEAARDALAALKAQKPDLTVCIYHGGFERDVNSGALLSETKENEGYRICQELNFDILLTGHQHMPLEDRCINGTFTCQPPDKARQIYPRGRDGGRFGQAHAVPALSAGEQTPAAFQSCWPPGGETAEASWTRPMGHLDTALTPSTPLKRALKGSLIANSSTRCSWRPAARSSPAPALPIPCGLFGGGHHAGHRGKLCLPQHPQDHPGESGGSGKALWSGRRTISPWTKTASPASATAFLKPIEQHYQF